MLLTGQLKFEKLDEREFISCLCQPWQAYSCASICTGTYSNRVNALLGIILQSITAWNTSIYLLISEVLTLHGFHCKSLVLMRNRGGRWNLGVVLFSLNEHWKKYFPSEAVEHAIRDALLTCQCVILDDLVKLHHTNNLHRKHLYKEISDVNWVPNRISTLFPIISCYKNSPSLFKL